MVFMIFQCKSLTILKYFACEHRAKVFSRTIRSNLNEEAAILPKFHLRYIQQKVVNNECIHYLPYCIISYIFFNILLSYFFLLKVTLHGFVVKTSMETL